MRKDSNFFVLVGTIGLFVCINIFLMASGKLPFSSDGFGIILGAGLTLAIYSFLYKDNPAFKIAENLYVGVSLGYTIIITWFNFLKTRPVRPAYCTDVFKSCRKGPSVCINFPFTVGNLYAPEILKEIILAEPLDVCICGGSWCRGEHSKGYFGIHP